MKARAALLGVACLLIVVACVDSLDLVRPSTGALPAGQPVCAERDATFRRKIVVDPSRVAGSADLLEFPVLVSVGAAAEIDAAIVGSLAVCASAVLPGPPPLRHLRSS